MIKQLIKIKIILFILIINSCKNHEDAYIKGQAIEVGSGTPIPGLAISLMHGFKDNNGAHKWETIATTTSDQNGFYEIRFHRKLFNDYSLKWESSPPGYFPNHDSYDIQHFKTAHTISFIPLGYLKLQVKKNGYSGSFIKVYTGSPDTYNVPVVINNNPFDSTFHHVFKMRSVVQTEITWDYCPDISSSYQMHTNHLTINKGDTVTHTIEFD